MSRQRGGMHLVQNISQLQGVSPEGVISLWLDSLNDVMQEHYTICVQDGLEDSEIVASLYTAGLASFEGFMKQSSHSLKNRSKK